jgi:23S rRNA (uracil1939-C5)-methyltransferase
VARLDVQADVTVQDLAHDGRGVARLNGKAVFVSGALPGETVRIALTKRRRQFDEARLLEVLRPSADRVVPRCAHFGVCGGCSLQHLAPAAQLAAKQRQLLENLERIGRVSPVRVLPPLAGPAFHYRRRARLGVRYVHKKGRVLAGFREQDKPYVADLKRCEVLEEPLGDLPAALAALAETLEIREQLPQVEVAAAENATALVLRVMKEPGAADLGKIQQFAAARNLQIYLQPGGLNTVRALGEVVPLRYRLDAPPVTIEFGPVDFVQVNATVNAAMVGAALEHLAVRGADRVLDLFCGLGNFTLPLARRAHAVTGVEGDRALIEKARANALGNGLDNLEFAVENLFEPQQFGAWADRRYDLVLLDPPRAGALELLPRMAEWRPRRVLYISCHPGSLARDAGQLCQQHGFTLTAAGVMDMFPHTAHVESIAVFEANT